MEYTLAIVYTSVPILLAVFNPRFLIHFILFTGMFPPPPVDRLLTPFGVLDMLSVRLIGVLAACSFLALVYGRALYYARIYAPHLLFLGACTLTLLWAPDFMYGLRVLAKLWAPLLFLISFQIVVTNAQHVIHVERTIVLVSVSALATAILYSLAEWAYSVEFYATYMSYPVYGVAVFSCHLLMVMMLLLSRAYTQKGILPVCLVMVAVVAMLCTVVRISIAGMVAGVCVVSILLTTGLARVIIIIFAPVLLTILFFTVDVFKGKMFLGGGENISLGRLLNNPTALSSAIAGRGRFEIWDALLRGSFDANPIFGHGIGSAQHMLYSEAGEQLQAPHSDYIMLLCDTGVVGISLFVFVCIMYIRKMLANYLNANTMQERRYSAAGLGALVALLIFMATDNGINYFLQAGVFLFALIAMSEKAREIEINKEPRYRKAAFALNSDEKIESSIA